MCNYTTRERAGSSLASTPEQPPAAIDDAGGFVDFEGRSKSEIREPVDGQ